MSDDPISDIWRSTERMLARPKFTFSFLISVAIIHSHLINPDNSFFSMLLPPTSTNEIVIWLREDLMKLCGVAMMIPTAMDAQPDRKFLVFFALSLFVLLIDTLTLWEYFALAIFFEIWNHVVYPITHIIMAVAVIVFTQLGWFSFVPFSGSGGGTVNTTNPIP